MLLRWLLLVKLLIIALFNVDYLLTQTVNARAF